MIAGELEGVTNYGVNSILFYVALNFPSFQIEKECPSLSGLSSLLRSPYNNGPRLGRSGSSEVLKELVYLILFLVVHDIKVTLLVVSFITRQLRIIYTINRAMQRLTRTTSRRGIEDSC